VIPLALTANDAVGLAVVAALIALVVAAGVRVLRKKGAEAPGPEVPQAEIERELQGAEPLPEEEAPEAPAPATPAARARPVAEPAPAAPAGPSAAEAAEAAAAKAREEADEEAKKAAYRAKKEADRLEREQKQREREAAEQRAREEAARAAAEAEAARQAEREAQRRKAEAEAGKTLAAGLEKTRGGFMSRLNALLGGGKQLDDSVLADLEEVLFTADIGVKTATRLLETVREKVRARALSDPGTVKAALRAEIARILALDGAAAAGRPFAPGEARPWVVMVVGVNGSGKTTTIGKLAAKLKAAGSQVLLGAGDTFRAAAGEQLEVWADRVQAPIVRGKEGADPASVCFEAVQQGAATGADVVLCDTAGRLHTKTPLMEELKKVKRVIGKAAPGAPHEVLLVLDATSGQNAIQQARQFHEALQVTGLVLTKLDGTAKGGVVIGITDELKLPVRYVGVGETVADLKAFQPAEFVEALFE
jgi:fused signal recognition particle receptor